MRIMQRSNRCQIRGGQASVKPIPRWHLKRGSLWDRVSSRAAPGGFPETASAPASARGRDLLSPSQLRELRGQARDLTLELGDFGVTPFQPREALVLLRQLRRLFLE